MRRSMMPALALILLVFAKPVVADDLNINESKRLAEQMRVLQQELQQLREVVREQQEQINRLKQNPEAQQITAPVVRDGTVSAGEGPAANGNNGMFAAMPEIGVIGDIVATQSDTLDRDEGNDRISVRELELVLGSDIDPYSRFDTTLAFSDSEHVHLEEAYVSYWELPWGIKGRIGRMHQIIGKASTVHRDSLPTVDEPLVVQEYLGTEGFYRTGLDFAGFTPFSSDSFAQQLIVGTMEGGIGEGGQLFGEAEDRPSFYSRLSNFWNNSEMANFELVGTYLLGSEDDDSELEVDAFGLDATFIQHFSPINKLTLQGEILFQRRSRHFAAESAESHEGESLAAKHEHGEEEEDEHMEGTTLDPNSFGFYVLADYRLSERWAIGSRYDWVEPIELSLDSTREQDQAGSLFLTFMQSEYARWRLQYEYARLVDGQDDNRFFLQGTFAIGTHKHQIQ